MRMSELLQQRREPVETWSTGLAALNHLTGGFTQGSLWVITGAPGTGKTTLLTQLLHQLATEHDFPVHWHTARSDSLGAVQERLLSLTTRRPRPLPAEVPSLEPLSAAQQTRVARLLDADLDFYKQRGWSIAPEWGVTRSACLAIDEPEFNRPPVLGREGLDELREFADRSNIVLVTVPQNHCTEPAQFGDRLRWEWASVADVIIQIVPTDEPGGAELRTLRNRFGPSRAVSVVFQPHLARFVQSEST